jgi:hypothetical protein
MEAHNGVDAADVAGIKNEDGSVKCRACMKEEDWKKLTRHNVITTQSVDEGEEWVYCDYCEKKL